MVNLYQGLASQFFFFVEVEIWDHLQSSPVFGRVMGRRVLPSVCIAICICDPAVNSTEII